MLLVQSSSLIAWQQVDFNRDVRPILSENCFFCHGQDPAKREAGLRLDQREPAVDAGAISPGDVEISSLIERVFDSDPDMRMPPAHFQPSTLR